ncbi:MAG: RdgB/HAM1 family non-canonical purine NTP pyrophosphatase [Nitrospinae bacterium]|nr:RdgB/HAM1 family non-canonical purine NTP pyrophosphatase [Nitrospinota bacterium]
MKKIILATRNEGKLREFNHAFEGTGMVFVSLKDIPGAPEVEEHGDTYAQNALIKARAIAERTGLPTVADDSGIEIAAMPGELGVKSARYAGDRPYAQVNAEILEKLAGTQNRACRYVCAIAFVDSASGREELVEATCEGVIHTKQEGDQGFGFDPIFLVPEYGKTMAQLPLEAKNSISHRAKAIEKLKKLLGQPMGA